jgi:hypothetical protein
VTGGENEHKRRFESDGKCCHAGQEPLCGLDELATIEGGFD